MVRKYFVIIFILILLLIFTKINMDYFSQPEISIPQEQIKYYYAYWKLYPEHLYINYVDLFRGMLNYENCKLDPNTPLKEAIIYNLNKLYVYFYVKLVLTYISGMLSVILLYYVYLLVNFKNPLND